MKGKFILGIILFGFITTLTSCQEKEIDFREDSNYNQAIDVSKFYLKLLNDDFTFGISVAGEIADAWEDAIDNYGRNWSIAFTNLYLSALFNINKFTYRSYYHTGKEIMDMIDTESSYLPEQIKDFKELYVLFLQLKDMIEEPSGSLVSYRKDINDTKKKFNSLYRSLSMNIPELKQIDVRESKKVGKIPDNLIFIGITKGTARNQVIEILKTNNIKYEERDYWKNNNGKIIEIKDYSYHDMDWDISIYIINEFVAFIEFSISELDMSFTKYDVVTAIREYHDIIKTPIFNNFYYEKTEFDEFLDYGINSYFKSYYTDIYGNKIELHRYGGTRIDAVKIFIDNDL